MSVELPERCVECGRSRSSWRLHRAEVKQLRARLAEAESERQEWRQATIKWRVWAELRVEQASDEVCTDDELRKKLNTGARAK